jgi:hypothetical protein
MGINPSKNQNKRRGGRIAKRKTQQHNCSASSSQPSPNLNLNLHNHHIQTNHLQSSKPPFIIIDHKQPKEIKRIGKKKN